MVCNDRWLERWPDSVYVSLSPRTSDHSPLVLKGTSDLPRASMFRFDNYLAQSPGFIHEVHNVWRHGIMGTRMYAVTRKLKALKPVFRMLRRSKGDLSRNVLLAKDYLAIAQRMITQDRHNGLLLHLEYCCQLVLLKATKLEQSMLHQRAKLQWLKSGDQCTRVFFRRVAKRRAIKRIFQIETDGGTIVVSTNEFISFYQRLLGGERTNWFIDLSFLRPSARYLLSEEDSAVLIKPVTAAEVKMTFFDVAEDKSPGPDGSSSGFFKVAWPIVKEEVTQAILEFFLNGKIMKQVNATLLVLIPKVQAPSQVSDFRPISCCNVLYKVITKIIVQRLRPVLDSLISPSQNAFVPGRSIGDNILLAQELFTVYNQQHLPLRCALKVDLWARGLRQGDPMSPYLFVLVMEVLHLILRQLIDQDGGFGYHWQCTELSLFQLCFADDLLLFCKAEVPLVSIFQQGLQRFATMSGLHANPSKSQLIISKSAAHMRADLLGHLTSARGAFRFVDPYGSSYILGMAFILPKGIIREVEQRLRTFLWKGHSGGGYAKVAWSQVCRPKEEGGLGIRDVLALNRALMSKHLWRIIIQDRTSIWVEWILTVRLRTHSIWTVSDRVGSWGWRKPLILPFIEYRVGNGEIFLVWQDPLEFSGIIWKLDGGTFTTAGSYTIFFPLGPKELERACYVVGGLNLTPTYSSDVLIHGNVCGRLGGGPGFLGRTESGAWISLGQQLSGVVSMWCIWPIGPSWLHVCIEFGRNATTGFSSKHTVPL
ncbi:UNVERIFIED_CONTAM: LINE-1 reverse transcriptase [Sesamum latifolium]|uniref:LINE-1 reverse transcriptase n=1 Tax=Sesamum latifolium TaxID=2727402 RepID=A0AAW2X2G7_9LAMI